MSQCFTKDYVVNATGDSQVSVNTLTQDTTSGTSIDFSIPSGVKTFRLVFHDLSIDAVTNGLIRLGDSGGILSTSGAYEGSIWIANTTNTLHDTGFQFTEWGLTTYQFSGIMTFVLLDEATNLWTISGTAAYNDVASSLVVSGSVALSSELTTVRMTTVSGTANFDQGKATVQYENPDLATSIINQEVAGSASFFINGTATATSSGTSHDITGIPSGIKQLYIGFDQVDLSGTEHLLIQLGTSSGFVTSGYLGSTTRTGTGASSEKNTTGIEIFVAGPAENVNGVLTLTLMNEATGLWMCSGTLGSSDTTSITMHQGFQATLSGKLSQIRIKSESTDTFTGGNVYIQYEDPEPEITASSRAAGVTDVFVNGTKQNTTSGTSIDFTGIPSGVKEIKVSFIGVSTTGTSNYIIQLGDSGGIEATGYLGSADNSTGSANFTAGFGIRQIAATSVIHGTITLTLAEGSTNTWTCSGSVAPSDNNNMYSTAGSKALSGELTQLRITTVGGTETFDAGAINIQYDNQELDLGSGVISGGVVQTVRAEENAYLSGTTTIPYDDTIPQSTEGDEYITASITPTNANNILHVVVQVPQWTHSSASSGVQVGAIFLDSETDARAAGNLARNSLTAGSPGAGTVDLWMTAGQATSMTFKFRCGGNGAGTTYINGSTAARRLGGVQFLSMTITEYKV